LAGIGEPMVSTFGGLANIDPMIKFPTDFFYSSNIEKGPEVQSFQ
jgi:hypothetical protein